MWRKPSLKGLAIASAATAALIGAAFITLMGTLIVVDDTGEIESVFVVTGSGEEQRLNGPLRGHFYRKRGYFYAIPRYAGPMRVHCRNGSVGQGGYVSPHVKNRERIGGDAPCEQFGNVIKPVTFPLL